LLYKPVVAFHVIVVLQYCYQYSCCWGASQKQRACCTLLAAGNSAIKHPLGLILVLMYTCPNSRHTDLGCKDRCQEQHQSPNVERHTRDSQEDTAKEQQWGVIKLQAFTLKLLCEVLLGPENNKDELRASS
jgi:hypothetical protein